MRINPRYNGSSTGGTTPIVPTPSPCTAVVYADRIKVPQLPEPAVVCILQHLPLRERLQLALVCQSWSKACALTTVAVEAASCSKDRTLQVQSWLHSWNKQVLGIRLSQSRDLASGGPHLQLHCSRFSNLEQLQLSGCAVKLTTAQESSNTPGCRHARSSLSAGISSFGQLLPRLQQLRLSDGRLPVSQLQQVGSLTGLTSFCFERMRATKAGTAAEVAPVAQLHAALGSVLPQLPNLSELCLSGLLPQLQGLPDEPGFSSQPPFLTPVSSMQRLQRLTFDNSVCADVTPLLPLLPVRLTYLHVEAAACQPDSSQALAASRLENLQHVEFLGGKLNPGLLHRWYESLRRVELSDVDCVVTPA